MQLLPTLRRRDSGFLPTWPDFDLLEDQMHRLARNLPWAASAGEGSIWAPRVDFAEQNGEYVLTAELPGIEPKDVDIEMDGNILSVRGERKVETERGDQRVRIAERQYGAFERSFTLPSPADPEKIKADFHQGVLKVRIQKRPEAKGRKIPVQAT
ncbi:MAG: Hsp20/alpha crystallin family protein [Gemmatimonadota bacterium]